MTLYDLEHPAHPLPAPLARRSDPATSHEGARKIAPQVKGLVLWAADCVRLSPGKTRKELGKLYSPDDPDRLGKRLDGAVKAGLVRRGESRECEITGFEAQTWYPVEGA